MNNIRWWLLHWSYFSIVLWEPAEFSAWWRWRSPAAHARSTASARSARTAVRFAILTDDCRPRRRMMSAAMGEDVEQQEALAFIPSKCAGPIQLPDRICHRRQWHTPDFAGHPTNAVQGFWAPHLRTKFPQESVTVLLQQVAPKKRWYCRCPQFRATRRS